MIYAYAGAEALGTIFGRTLGFLVLLGVLAVWKGVPPGLDLQGWALLYFCFYGFCSVLDDLSAPFLQAFKTSRTQGDDQ